jgi:FAD/FMN-containing dehydrogenase
VVRAASTADVVAAVRLAPRRGARRRCDGHRHGTTAPCDGGLLISTAGLRDARVDPVARTARVSAGARWSDVVPAAAAHGLATLTGSSSGVGVVGYTLGGGFGWLGRRYGFAAGSVTAAEVVTADGELVRADADENPDLLWGVKGGAGNLGGGHRAGVRPAPRRAGVRVATSTTPRPARDLLEFYAEWSRTLPDGMATAATFRRFPPLPQVPEPLRGRAFVAVRGCWSGPDPRDGERLLAPVRPRSGRRRSTRSPSCPSPASTPSAPTRWTRSPSTSTTSCCAT